MEPIVFDLTLVRHGRTDANRQGIVQGHVDTPLDQLGIIQATRLGRLLSKDRFDFAFASDLKRAHLTCQLVLSQQVEDDQSKMSPVVRTLKCLRERSYGVGENLSFSQYYQLAADANQGTAYDFVPEGGESLSQLQSRAKEFLEIMYNYATTGSGEELFENCKEESTGPSEKLTQALDSLSDHDKMTIAHTVLKETPFLPAKSSQQSISCIIASHGGFIREFMKLVTSGNPSEDVVSPEFKKLLITSPANTSFTHFTLTMNSPTEFTLTKLHYLYNVSHLNAKE